MDPTTPDTNSQREHLADILDGYMLELEQGNAPDEAALLAAHPNLADELRPYLEDLRMLHGATKPIRAAKDSSGGAKTQIATTEAGARQIGEYRIVREIGRGGMGIVYEAHQVSLNRQVALKVLPFAAVLDQRQIARFRNEAQAAAQLHHPNIVPVFAVGQEHGVYYYAMQYIGGRSLDQAIGQLRSSVETQPVANLPQPSTKVLGPPAGWTTTVGLQAFSTQRSTNQTEYFATIARLGLEAASALQHAHEYGIVHRDIKPSNLLLDNQGKLWITDFGLARMQADSGITLTGDVVGTLRYMSPEQAAGKAALVDARTDIYSLGVTLYESLTLCPAHGGEDRQTLLRQVVNEDPLPPRKINPSIPLDLETIILTAMSKSREDRYPTAQAMAEDLTRFLAGEPTLARRPNLIDRASRWAKRHRAIVAIAACALVLLTLVSAGAAVLLVRGQAKISAALAKEEKSARTARSAVDQLGMQLADRLAGIPGAEVVRNDVMLDTLRFYRHFAEEAAGDSKLRHELAIAHYKSGAIANKLGATADAIAEYRNAIEVLQKLAAADHENTEFQCQLGLAHNNIAILFGSRGEFETARQHFADAISMQRRLVADHPKEPSYASQLAESQGNLGLLLNQNGLETEAQQTLQAAVLGLRRLVATNPNEPQYVRNLAITNNNLSYVLRKHDVKASADAATEAVKLLRRLTMEYPKDLQFLDDLALCSNNMAAIESYREKFDSAINWHRSAIAIQEQMVRKAPAVVRHRSDLATSLNNLGVVHCRQGNRTEADAAFRASRDLLSTLTKDYPDEFGYKGSLAALCNNQALALAAAGRHTDAIAIYPQALDLQRACWQKFAESKELQESLSKMYYNYGQSLKAAGRPAEAVEVALKRRELWPADGERLLGVAAELASLREDSEMGSTAEQQANQRQTLDDEIIATLKLAKKCGWPRDLDVSTDERFNSIRKYEKFAEFLSEKNS